MKKLLFIAGTLFVAFPMFAMRVPGMRVITRIPAVHMRGFAAQGAGAHKTENPIEDSNFSKELENIKDPAALKQLLSQYEKDESNVPESKATIKFRRYKKEFYEVASGAAVFMAVAGVGMGTAYELNVLADSISVLSLDHDNIMRDFIAFIGRLTLCCSGGFTAGAGSLYASSAIAYKISKWKDQCDFKTAGSNCKEISGLKGSIYRRIAGWAERKEKDAMAKANLELLREKVKQAEESQKNSANQD